MLLWTCLHGSPKSYFRLIRWISLFYSCPRILLTGNTCKQLGCNATGWLLCSDRSCCKSQALAVSESSGVSVIYTSQMSPKRIHLMDVFLTEICCYVPFACLISFTWESLVVFCWRTVYQELPVSFSRSRAFMEHVLSWLRWVLFRLQPDFWGKRRRE